MLETILQSFSFTTHTAEEEATFMPPRPCPAGGIERPGYPYVRP